MRRKRWKTLSVLSVLFSFASSIAANAGTPPQLEAGSQNSLIAAKEGTNLKIKCPIIGAQPFSVEWFKNSVRIDHVTWNGYSFSGRSNQFLKIRNVLFDDGGKYLCKGVNGFGSAKFEFDVSVRGRYSVAGDEKDTKLLPNSASDIIVEEGRGFTMNCSVRNPDGVDVRWLKRVDDGQGDNINNNKNRQIDGIFSQHDANRNLIRMANSIDLDGHIYWHIEPSISSALDSRATIRTSMTAFDLKVFSLKFYPARESDSGDYACLVVKSLVDLDKSLRFNEIRVKVRKNATALSSTSYSDAKDNQEEKIEEENRISQLFRFLLIILPIILLGLCVVLCFILRKDKCKKSRRKKAVKAEQQQKQMQNPLVMEQNNQFPQRHTYIAMNEISNAKIAAQSASTPGSRLTPTGAESSGETLNLLHPPVRTATNSNNNDNNNFVDEPYQVEFIPAKPKKRRRKSHQNNHQPGFVQTSSGGSSSNGSSKKNYTNNNNCIRKCDMKANAFPEKNARMMSVSSSYFSHGDLEPPPPPPPSVFD